MQIIPNTLTIAGSDCSGGAGIQADLKTFAAHKCYGLSIICALTAQNTTGVQGVLPTPPAFIAQQLESVFSDIEIHAAKIGMLGNAAIVEIVAAKLQQFAPKILVLDSVMISQSGHKLLEDEAIAALKAKLIPLATLITPNLPEAAALLNCAEATTIDEMERQAQKLLALGAKAVLIKGGHMDGQNALDVLAFKKNPSPLMGEGAPLGADEGEILIHHFSAPRISTSNTHGTGCTLSAAITANLAFGLNLVSAIEQAKIYLTGALAAAKSHQLGKGDGPVHHFYQFWKETT